MKSVDDKNVFVSLQFCSQKVGPRFIEEVSCTEQKKKKKKNWNAICILLQSLAVLFSYIDTYFCYLSDVIQSTVQIRFSPRVYPS